MSDKMERIFKRKIYDQLLQWKQSWEGKTQLAKLIARRGGNEGAFGGILHYFSRKRRCAKTSKWRELLESAGIKFDANDYVVNWAVAKNPL